MRTNLRSNVANKSIMQIVRDIYGRPGGIANFYRGVVIYWISAVPTFGVLMYMYENSEKLLKTIQNKFNKFNKD